jgi:lactoylglutathione lyase/methylmalonyl-CoA/ethylmalonyl-CoA epimerase
MITKVDHIGIAVDSIESALPLYADILGLSVSGVEVVEEQKTKTAILPVGDTKIELLESTAPDGPIARHIESRGEGLHHIAFQVADIGEALKSLAGNSVRLIDETPRKGVENSSIAFLHPKATGKVLMEVVQA